MYTKIIIILSVLLSYSFAQRSPRDFERELKAQNSAIQSLKDEIEQTKKRIQSENKKEKSYQQYKIYRDKTSAGVHIKILSLLDKI